jgi:hypothetical protein
MESLMSKWIAIIPAALVWAMLWLCQFAIFVVIIDDRPINIGFSLLTYAIFGMTAAFPASLVWSYVAEFDCEP